MISQDDIALFDNAVNATIVTGDGATAPRLTHWIDADTCRSIATSLRRTALPIDPKGLTETQLAVGVAALRQHRAKFNGNESDGSLVYAVVYGVIDAIPAVTSNGDK
jgi:hypothetical protein